MATGPTQKALAGGVKVVHKAVDTTRIYTTPSEQDLQREVEKIALV